MAESLGEASVDVYADLSRLDSDFRDARAKTDAFTRDFSSKMGKAGKESAAAMRELDGATRSLVTAYSPLHAAALRHAEDLDKINVLQKSGIVSAQDIAMFTKKSAAAYEEATLAQSKMFQIGQKVGEQLKRYAELAALAAIAVGTLMVHSALEHATALEEQSKQLGITTDQLQKLQYIALQSGVSAGKLETGLIRLHAAFGQLATGNPQMAKLFTDLQINFQSASFKALDFNAKMQLVATQLSKVRDADERAAGGQMLFGRDFAGMLAIVSQGPEKIKALGDSFDKLGLALSEEEIQKLRETNIQLETMKNQLSVDFSHYVAANANAIVGLAKALESLTKGVLDFLSSNPQAAAALIGALAGGAAGGSIGGAKGALIGAAAGAGLGLLGQQYSSEKAADQNTNVAFRKKALMEATDELHARMNANASVMSQGGLFTIRHSNAKGGDLKSQTAEVRRQTQMLLDAEARAKAPKESPTGNLSLSNLHEPKPKKAPKAKQTPFDKLESDELTLQQELLRTLGLHVSNAEAKAQLDLQLLDIDKKKYIITLEQQVHSKSLTVAEAQILKTKYLEIDAAKRHEVDLQRQEQQRKDSAALEASADQNEGDIIAEREKLATTTKERVTAEMALLHLQTKMAISAQQEVIDSISSSDTQKLIAQAKIAELRAIEKIRVEEVRQQFQGPVEDFFKALPKSADEIQDALKRIRAANLEDVQKRTVQFADDVGAAFGNMANNILNLQSPLAVLKSLLADLTKVFTQETIIRPIENWARKTIGAPLAERVVGGHAGAEGLSAAQIRNSSLAADEKADEARLKAASTAATTNFNDVAAAAEKAATALNSIQPAPGAGAAAPATDANGELPALSPGADGFPPLPFDNPKGSATIQKLLDEPAIGADGLSDTISKLGDAASKTTGALSKFGGDLPQVLNQILSSIPTGGGGGGGGILGTILHVASAVAGSVHGLSAGGIARSNLTVGSTIAAHPGIFHDGGEIGPDAQPIRRPLRAGERNITALVGERVIRQGPSKKFGDMLDTINAGKLPRAPNMGMALASLRGGDSNHTLALSLGGIHVHGNQDDRSARQSGKQAASEIQSRVARAVKQGILSHDR